MVERACNSVVKVNGLLFFFFLTARDNLISSTPIVVLKEGEEESCTQAFVSLFLYAIKLFIQKNTGGLYSNYINIEK